jgi:hypothetical protein
MEHITSGSELLSEHILGHEGSQHLDHMNCDSIRLELCITFQQSHAGPVPKTSFRDCKLRTTNQQARQQGILFRSLPRHQLPDRRLHLMVRCKEREH